MTFDAASCCPACDAERLHLRPTRHDPPPRKPVPLTKVVRSAPPGRGLGFVYVMECGGFHKIGWSESPRFRQRSIQGDNPLPVTLVGVIEGTRDDEAQWHRAFIGKRVRGEWFRLDPEDVERVLHQSFGLAHLDSVGEESQVPPDGEWEPC